MQRLAHPGSRPGDREWRQIVGRDAEARFLFAVSSTGVFCRPSCAARRPLRENVHVFPDAAAARAAGYRACLRCGPEASGRSVVERAAETLRRGAREGITVRQAAVEVGITPEHLHRQFRARLGITPREFLQAERKEHARSTLQSGGTVRQAARAAGHRSAARLYGREAVGMPPGTYRRGGLGETVRFASARSSLGWLLVAATSRGVCSLRLGRDPRGLEADLRREFPKAVVAEDEASLGPVVREALRRADGALPASVLPLDLRGSAFQVRVWNELVRIPRGATRSYAEVATALGMPAGARAVARACATNPVALLVPCHRVVGGDGSLRGYRWGLERKRQLLDRERRDAR